MPTLPFLKMLAGHDPDLAFVGRQHAGAIGADQPRLRAGQRALDPDHVEHRNALGDGDDQRHFGVDRLEDRVRGERRRDVDHAGGGAGLRDRFVRPCRTPAGRDARAALPRRDAADHLRAVGERLLGVEGAGLTGHPLGDDLGVAVDEDAHASARLPSICLQATSSSFTASTLTLKFSRAVVVELDLDDLLDAAGADHARHADVEVVDAILAGECAAQGRTRFLSFKKLSAIAIALVAGA